MKNLNEFILESIESIRKQINIDDIDNNELKKFAEKVATYVSSRYYLDYPFRSDFVFHALSKLKGKKLKLSVKDFDMYETDEVECLYCIPIRKYYDSDPRKGWLDI